MSQLSLSNEPGFIMSYADLLDDEQYTDKFIDIANEVDDINLIGIAVDIINDIGDDKSNEDIVHAIFTVCHSEEVYSEFANDGLIDDKIMQLCDILINIYTMLDLPLLCNDYRELKKDLIEEINNTKSFFDDIST